ncbi:hypothetical protein LTR66_009738 [Elasticomyces elasticus]|nr:hypothetical protein LTR66_009738 [Elasticomyces elasticus]
MNQEILQSTRSGPDRVIASLPEPSSVTQPPLASPPRSSSRNAPFIQDSSSAEPGIAQTQHAKERSLLDVPQSSAQADEQNQSSSTGLSGATASDPAESIGRGSKRSLTERRKAGSNASSKKSQNARNVISEKAARSASPSGPVRSPDSRPKKSGISRIFGIFCCGSPDDGNATSSQLPAQVTTKPVAANAGRVTEPSQARQQRAMATNSTEDSKDVLDEKSASPMDPNDATVPTEIVSKKAVQGDALVDKPMPDLPPQSIASDPGSEATEKQAGNESLEDVGMHREAREIAGRVVTAPPIDATSQTTTPQITMQAPTPVVAQEEESIISDRTPQQEARDTDIEMTDAGPSLPLATSDLNLADEEEEAVKSNEQDRASGKVDLPPPPPLAERQAQMAPLAATPPSQDNSMVSTPAEAQKWLLPPIRAEHRGRKCLVLDLDETLVHSSFKILHQADFTIPVEIEGQYHNVYVIKRPGVDAFMKRVGELYEVVVFTASVSKGNYVKDLSQVGRDLRETIIIDNSPTSYIFHPQHAVPISSWFSDAHDNELLDLIPVLEDLAGPQVSDVSLVLDVVL